MILRALCDLATREGLVSDADFPLAKVSYFVTVTDDGVVRGVADVRETDAAGGKKPKLVPKSVPAPYQPARSGTKAPPSFLVDNAKYVFGRPTADKPFTEDEGREKSGWFRDLAAECARDTGDAGVRAVVRALERLACGEQVVALPADCKSNEQFAFVYEPDVDVLVHDRPAVREWWRARRRAPGGGDGGRFTCVVTGVPITQPGLFPKVKNVPGGQSAGVSLVSFNAPASESYGLSANENAPISRDAAEQAATALQRLVHPAFPDPRPGHAAAPLPRWHVRVGAETLVCFWANDAGADDFLNNLGALLDGDPAQVGEMYRAVWRGRPAPVRDAGAFYALTVSGAQGRLVIRDWFEDTVGRVGANVARHFADLAVVRNTPVPKGRDAPPDGFPLGLLLSALAPLGKRENVPPALGGELVRAALAGTPYPYAVLQRAVERARAEAGRAEWADLERRDARAALIKAVLRRTRNSLITPDMDPTNTNPGYLCGRLMAIVERLQTLALGDVNAGVVDRYFGAASATPRAVFVRLLRNAQHHARKAQDDPKSAGTAHWLKRQIDDISDRFDPKHNGFPAFLPLEDQGMFILGYHQQRHALWARRTDGGASDSTSSASDAPAGVPAAA